jgi:putative ATPase
MQDIGYGKGYEYDHDSEEGFSGQDYFPQGMRRQTFYTPTGRGYERDVRHRLETWSRLRERRQS